MARGVLVCCVVASNASAEPEVRTAEPYAGLSYHYGGADQSLGRLAIGARFGPTAERLDGLDVRVAATGVLANSKLLATGVGAEAEATYPLLTGLRAGARAGFELGTPGGGANHGTLFALGGVVRIYDVAWFELDLFRSRPGDNYGRSNLTPRYGVMAGFGVGGNPHWYGWLALGVAGLIGAAIGGAMAGGG